MAHLAEFNEFHDCVLSIFNHWSALQLAVDHGMGGSIQESNKKISDMANSIAALCFSKDASDGGDIAFQLEELMDDYFDTILEDDSADEVGQLLWDLSRQWSTGDKVGVINYVASLEKNKVKNHVETVASVEETEEMDVVEEKKVDEPDQDGWVVVKKKGHRH